MSIKSSLATVFGKSAYWVLHNVFKGGTSFPGKLAIKIDPTVLETLAKDYQTIVVTGTNGKTMTTALIVEALRKKYGDVLTNPSGSNMQQGIVTAFLAHQPKKGKKIAVLEVDEANVKRVTELLHPSTYVLTNIFRDQMDRYGEIYTTYDKILDGIKLEPKAKIIANGDDSIFASKKLPNPQVYYGFQEKNDLPDVNIRANVNTDGVLCPVCDHILHYHAISYANLGDYFCPNCGFHHPKLTYKLDAITDRTPNSISFVIDGNPFSINIGGTYNIYNALAAFATAREFGVTDAQIEQAFSENKRIFGRQELISYANKEINLILVKNPVGLNEVLSLLNTEKDDYSLVALLNAQHADGIDTSWIWDGNFEELNKNKIKQVYVGGERFHDMAFRLEVAGFEPGKMKITANNTELLDELKTAPTKKIYILATYTAMLSLRKTMAEQKIIKAGLYL